MNRHIKIVQDRAGLYSIRKGLIWHKYLDLTLECNIWWAKSSIPYCVLRNCTTDNFHKVSDRLQQVLLDRD
jgi:hypothetical protein